MMKLLYAIFPDIEFHHLHEAAKKDHPDKRDDISKIYNHYIHNTRSDISYARRAFAALSVGGTEEWK